MRRWLCKLLEITHGVKLLLVANASPSNFENDIFESGLYFPSVGNFSLKKLVAYDVSLLRENLTETKRMFISETVSHVSAETIFLNININVKHASPREPFI